MFESAKSSVNFYYARLLLQAAYFEQVPEPNDRLSEPR
jgi:hypothetical protein